MLLVLVFLPALAAAASALLRTDAARVRVLQATAFVHLAMVAAAWRWPAEPMLGGYVALDALGLLSLASASVLFAGVAVYLPGYLARSGRPAKVFVSAMLGLLSAMSLIAASQHLGLFWVAMEASTLASAPLIYFHHSGRALEATWKYLIVGSVGIALALLGTIFLAVAATDPATGDTTLFLPELLAQARAASLSMPWLHGAYLFILVGYGAKMGLAPMHGWKPDAYGEAPPPVAAVLAGSLTTCAFLGLVRVTQILVHAGEVEFVRSLLVPLGLLSLAVAAAFMVGQSDFRRLLAYSSIENMGVLVFGLGFGLLGAQGSMLQVVNNSFNKGILYLIAGNLLAAYGTSTMASVKGVLRRSPATGALLLAGALAGMGLPPFGLFVSELTILRAAMDGGGGWAAGLYLALLAIMFLAVAAAVLPMVQGEPEPAGAAPAPPERWRAVLPPAAFTAAALVMGVYIPAPLATLVEQAAAQIGGR
jgi:hydrogenase-4 component F